MRKLFLAVLVVGHWLRHAVSAVRRGDHREEDLIDAT